MVYFFHVQTLWETIMSVLYTESAIHTQKQYVVQQVSKFPSDKNFLIGKTVLVVEIEGTTASVRQGAGVRHYIPLRSLIHVQGYEAKSVHAKNADGFVVKCPNSLGIPVGTAYLEPTSVDESKGVVKFDIDGKVVTLPLSILIKLVRKTVKVTDKKVKKEAKSSPVPLTVIEAVGGAIRGEGITSLPPAVTKLLPDLNIPVLIDTIKNAEEEVFDFKGDVHNNIGEALKANDKYIHELIQKIALEEVNKLLSQQFESIRNN